MSVLISLTDQQVCEVADLALRRTLSDHGFDHAEVRSGEDHDGEDAVFITAVMDADIGVVPGDVLARAHEALDEGLRARGEARFPYFKLQRIGDTPVNDSDLEPEP